jgi:hypothetical protein
MVFAHRKYFGFSWIFLLQEVDRVCIMHSQENEEQRKTKMYAVKNVDCKWVVVAGKVELASFATENEANRYADYMDRMDRRDNGR